LICFPQLGRTAFDIETDVQNDTNYTNIYLQKMKEMFDNDVERTRLAKIHRIIPINQLASLCVYVFHFKRWANLGTPSDFWLSEHIHQLRFEVINKEKTRVDLIQLLIDAGHSNEVSIENSNCRR
jgi:hypothetical protein